MLRRALGGACAVALLVLGSNGAREGRADTSRARPRVTSGPPTWVQTAELVAKDGKMVDLYGSAVAISGDTAIVGSPQAQGNWGTAYVYSRSAGVWSLQEELNPPLYVSGDFFGAAIALQGTTAFIDGEGETVGSNASQGVVFVYEPSGGSWTLKQTLSASDGAANEQFGGTLAVSGNTLFVGVPEKTVGTNTKQGAVYVFTLSGSTWTQTQKLVASDGAASDWFGTAIAVSGNTALIGANFHTVGANTGQGVVYVFQLSGGNWTQTQELSGSAGQQGDGFGGTIALSGTTALIGASQSFTGNSGEAYVFAQSGSTWTEEARLVSSDSGADGVGSSVGFAEGMALLGAPNAYGPGGTSVIDQGAIYTFTGSGSTWTEGAAIRATDGASLDGFGYAIATSGTDLVVGAYEKTIGTNAKQGAAYLESFGGGNGTTCSGAADCATTFCVDGVCCDGACTGPCHACTAALKGTGTDGTCGPVKSGTSCGVTCTGNQRTTSSCDATGTCVVGSKTTCPGGYACDGTTACATSCTTAAQCASNYDCMNGKCFPSSDATCSTDGHSVVRGGVTTSCAPYTCIGGACQATCTTAADCVAPSVCGADHKCGAAPSGGSSGGCGCVLLGSGSGPSPLGLGVIALVGAALVRRRRSCWARDAAATIGGSGDGRRP